MILAWLHARAERRRGHAEAVVLAADHMIRFNGGDLDRAFWSAHRRWEPCRQASADRGVLA